MGESWLVWDRRTPMSVTRPRPRGGRCPRSCSRPSTCPPCTSPSRPCSPCTPPAVLPVSSWTPVTVSPTVSPSTRVTLSPTPSSVLTWLAVSSPTTTWGSSPSVATPSPPPPSARLSVTSRRSSATSPWTSSRRCPPLPPPPPSRSPTSFPTARSSPSATRDSGAPRLSSSLPSLVWRLAESTRPPTTWACTPVLPTGCRRRSPLLPHPPSRSRSSLPPRGSTPSGSEGPSWPLSPPSSRCGSPSRSTTSLAPPLCTGSASKHLVFFYCIYIDKLSQCIFYLVRGFMYLNIYVILLGH